MSEYVSAQSFLADARLRLDALGPESVALIVEGPDDRRLFLRFVQDKVHIIPTGGRTLLLNVYSSSTEEDISRLLFLTDCDYEVRRGTLRGGAPSLIITDGTDLECDLLDLGLLETIIGELSPRADTMDGARQLAREVLCTAKEFAIPLGRIRMAAQPMGVPLDLEAINHSRHWDSQTQTVDIQKLLRTTHNRILRESTVPFEAWQALFQATPNDSKMVHGKDMLHAIHWVLRRDYGLSRDITADVLARMLRLSFSTEHASHWSVFERIRRWEAGVGKKLLL